MPPSRPTSSPRRGPRTGGDAHTREQILAAAREAFNERGFSGTSLRDIATRAGVDVALVSYYFGGKTALFGEAIEIPTKPADLVQQALVAPRDRLGQELVRVVLTTWDDPAFITAMKGVVQLQVTNQDNWASLTAFYRDQILAPIADAAGGDAPEFRAAMAASPLIGLIAVRYLVGVPAVQSAPLETLVAEVGAQVQRWLTGPLPGARG